MEAAIQLLTPEQVDAILAVYATLADWYSQGIDFISNQTSNIVVEDLFL